MTLRASFTDRTLAWVSSWGRKKLISAPFLFYPQRFFEVGLSHHISPGAYSHSDLEDYGLHPGVGEQTLELGSKASPTERLSRHWPSVLYTDARDAEPRNTGIMNAGGAKHPLSLKAPLSL